MTVKNRFANLYNYLVILWVLIVALGPIIWLVLSSLKVEPQARPGFMLPESIYLQGYISTFRDLNVMQYFGNSMFIAGVSVVLSILMISCRHTWWPAWIFPASPW